MGYFRRSYGTYQWRMVELPCFGSGLPTSAIVKESRDGQTPRRDPETNPEYYRNILSASIQLCTAIAIWSLVFFFFLRGCRQWLQSSPKCIHYKTIITSMSKFNSSAVDFETPNFIFHLFGDDYICWYGWLVVLFEVYRHSFLIDFSRICWP